MTTGRSDPDPYQGLPVGVLTVNKAQSVLTCDEVFCETFGCSPSDVVDRTLDELLSPRDRRASLELATKMSAFSGGLLDLLATLRIRGRDFAARLRLTTREGGYVVFAEPAFGDDNLLYRLTVVEQRWKGMFRSSDDGIVILDGSGCIVEHNASFYSLMRFRDAHGVSLSEDAVVGRSMLDLVRSEFAGFAEYLQEPDGEFEARSNSSERCLELRAMPLTLPSGARIGTSVVVRDVAEEIQIAARDAIIRSTLVRARSFQRAILAAPPAVPGHDIHVAYRPLDEVGGDIYDIAVQGNVVRTFIADATGHGVPAALVTMLIKSAYEFVKHSNRGPAWILKTLNDRIASAHGNLDVMCSAAIVDVDLGTRTVRHACGGHPAPLVARGGNVEELESGGTFVGIEPGVTFPSWKRQLAPDEALYLVTDGIAEARRSNGEFFGEARLHRAIAEANELPNGAGDAIFARLESWLRPETQNDDVTIIAVRPV